MLYKIISRFVLNVLFLVSHLSHSSPHLSLSIAQGTLVIAHCLLLISRPGGMRGAIELNKLMAHITISGVSHRLKLIEVGGEP